VCAEGAAEKRGKGGWGAYGPQTCLRGAGIVEKKESGRKRRPEEVVTKGGN